MSLDSHALLLSSVRACVSLHVSLLSVGDSMSVMSGVTVVVYPCVSEASGGILILFRTETISFPYPLLLLP